MYHLGRIEAIRERTATVDNNPYGVKLNSTFYELDITELE